MSNFWPLYKRNSYKLLINPFTYFSGIVFVAFTVIHYFTAQNFFSFTGTTDLRSFFAGIPYISILIIPSLCAVEGFSNSELCMPGKTFELVISKILSAASFYLVFIIFTFLLPVYIGNFGDVQVSQVITAYLGIIFYIAASFSLSVFFFILIQNPAISFLITALVLAVINSIHLLSANFNLPAPLSYAAKELSFAWHFDAFGKGIIDTRDIVFYVVLALVFFLLSVIRIENVKGNKTQSFKKWQAVFFITLALVFADGNRFYSRLDVTKNKQFTVTSYSKTLLKEIQDPLEITYYRSPVLANLYPQVRDVKDFLEQYAAENKNITLTVIDPVKKDCEASLNNYGIYGQVIDTSGNGSSVSKVYSAVVVSYLDKLEVIPFVFNTSTLEFDLTSRVQAMVRGTVRNVQIVCGNGLSLESDYYFVEPWLQSMGFNTIQTVLPSEKEYYGNAISFDQLPEIPLLIIGTSYFSNEDTITLDNYLKRGGKAFISTTPYVVDYLETWNVTPVQDNVIFYLQEYGLYFKETLTCDISNFRITFYSDTTTSGTNTTPQTEYVNYALWPVLLPQTNALNGMTCFWPCAIDLDEDVASDNESSVSSLIVTSSKAWQLEKIKGSFESNPFVVPQTPEGNDKYSQYNLACKVNINNGHNGQFIVFGDQYAFTKAMFNYTAGENGDMRNLDFLTDSLLTLIGQGPLLELKNRNYVNTALYKADNLDVKKETITAYGATVIFPCVVMILIYVCVYYKRRKFNSFKFEKHN